VLEGISSQSTRSTNKWRSGHSANCGVVGSCFWVGISITSAALV
jgi:hypothetical protein